MTDTEIIKTLALFMGCEVFTDDEMRSEAERVWKTQPDCRHFMMGVLSLNRFERCALYATIPRLPHLPRRPPTGAGEVEPRAVGDFHQ